MFFKQLPLERTDKYAQMHIIKKFERFGWSFSMQRPVGILPMLGTNY